MLKIFVWFGPQDMAGVCAMIAGPRQLTRYEIPKPSILCALTPSTAIMEDKVHFEILSIWLTLMQQLLSQ